MEAARAAQRVKDACTIDEAELLALRPTLLKGYAAIHSQERLVQLLVHHLQSSAAPVCLLTVGIHARWRLTTLKTV